MAKFRKKPVVIDAYQTEVPMDIETLEGTMHADPGDWIITGVKGERYPCKPDIFAQTYDRATDKGAAEEGKNVCRQIVEAVEEFCDCYCKYPDMYVSKDPDADVDMLEDHMYTEICVNCPMRKLC